MLTIEARTPGVPVADALVHAYLSEVASRWHGRPATEAELARAIRDEPWDDLQGDSGLLLVALDDDGGASGTVGCAGVRFLDGVAELTKVFTLRTQRGRGVATRLLAAAELACRRRGIGLLRLDTRAELAEACAFYERSGFERVDPFTDDPHSDRWYRKVLEPSVALPAAVASEGRRRVTSPEDVAAHVTAAATAAGRPLVVGISGPCGSGKSTLARDLVPLLPDAVRVRGDDFLDPARSHLRSRDWDGVDRARLGATVLAQFRSGAAGEFQRYDWSRRELGAAEPLPRARVLVVDVIGLLHPEVLALLDVTLWCDVDVDVAAERGRARDRELGRDHDALSREVWEPNDRDFVEAFRPRDVADLLYVS